MGLSALIFFCWVKVVGKRTEGRISKRVLQENNIDQIFQKTSNSYPDKHTHVCVSGAKKCSGFFWKIWRALSSCNDRTEIRPSALLPTKYLFLNLRAFNKKIWHMKFMAIFFGYYYLTLSSPALGAISFLNPHPICAPPNGNRPLL